MFIIQIVDSLLKTISYVVYLHLRTIYCSETYIAFKFMVSFYTEEPGVCYFKARWGCCKVGAEEKDLEKFDFVT